MFKNAERGFEVFLARFIVVDFVEFGEETFEGVHDFKAEEVVEALKATDADTLVKDVKGFEGEDFLFLFEVIEPEGRLDED